MSESEQPYMSENIASRMQSPVGDDQAEAGAQMGDEMALSHHEDANQVDGCR